MKNKSRVVWDRGAQIPGVRSPRRPYFVQWPQIFVGYSIWNVLYVTPLSPGILRWLLDF